MNPNQRRGLYSVTILICSLAFGVSEAAVIYVDADSPAVYNGQTWETAYKYLQDALTTATYGDEIHVAQGIYLPDETLANPEGSGAQDDSFILADGILLKGGYAGFGTADPNARDVTAFETVLSGDLDGNDSELTNASGLLSDPNRSENCYHVITGSGNDPNTLLDGFTITGGMAVGTDPHFNGGAILLISANPTINNCRFEYNAALNGGAEYNLSSNPTITNCIFLRNFAQDTGGGLRNINFSNPLLSNCTFLENKAAAFGGAMANSNNSSPTIAQCTFSYNWADRGGAVNNYDFCSPLFTQSVFRFNATDNSGGAIRNENHSDVELMSCGLYSNTAAHGAGIYNYQSNPTIVNSVASGNFAVEYGGVFYNRDAIDISIVNCSLVGNTAAIRGASLYNTLSSLTIENCILWDNNDPNDSPIYTESGSPPTINYCCIQGGWAGGTGNIDSDPLFIDPNGPDRIIGTTDDNFKLFAESLCIDAGDNTVVPADISDMDDDSDVLERIPLDYIGQERFVNVPDVADTGLKDMPQYPNVVDMGALERNKPILVDILASGPEHDGTVWNKAFNHIQDALTIADYGDVIWVAQGVYHPDQTETDPDGTGDRTAAFELVDGVTLKGGYAGLSQADPNARDIELYPSVLSGDLLENDAPVSDASQIIDDLNRIDNSYHILKADGMGEHTELNGFVISGGMAVGVDPYNTGGGIRLVSSNLTINNCRFEENAAEFGGAVYNLTSSPVLTDCTFLRNYAQDSGGALRNYFYSNPVLSGCTLNENKAASFGGAIANKDNSNQTATECSFSSNWAYRGGAINGYDSCDSRFIQCIFQYNISDNSGGAIRNEIQSDAELVDCDLNNNTAATGAGLYNIQSNSNITSCDFFDNTTTGNGGAICSIDSDLLITNSVFSTNHSLSEDGGAIYHSTSLAKDPNTLMFDDCVFTDNSSYQEGGAVYNSHGNLSLKHCDFRYNQAEVNGGGIYNITADVLNLWHCILSSNSAFYDGGAMYIEGIAVVDITNSLITYNDADYGGGIANTGASTANLVHSTISDNTAIIGAGIYNSVATAVIQNSIVSNTIIPSDSVMVDHSCVPGWPGSGLGNITLDPEFVDSDGPDNIPGNEDDDFRVTSTSPCLDAADNAAIPAGLEMDLDGHDRVVDADCSGSAIADMGAYEFSYLSKGDFDLSCSVDFSDFAALAAAWLTEEGDEGYNADCDISIPADQLIDVQDLEILSQYWLGIE